MPKEMLLRLTREAVMHLSKPKTETTASLRALCRLFRKQHKLRY